METMDSDDYQCFTCDRIFRGRVFEIAREWERVHFSENIPDVEIEGSYGIECFCSQLCTDLRREEVMAREGVPIHHPDLGPIEPCSKCGAPIDMTQFHLAYVESCVDMHGCVGRQVDVEYLAVVCSTCRPRHVSRRQLEISQRRDDDKHEKTICDVANEVNGSQPQEKTLGARRNPLEGDARFSPHCKDQWRRPIATSSCTASIGMPPVDERDSDALSETARL